MKPPSAGRLRRATKPSSPAQHRIKDSLLHQVLIAFRTHLGAHRWRDGAGEPAAAARCLRYALTLFADVATSWWQARTLAELALSLDEAGAADAAREHRRAALALCEQLGTGLARALAAELEPQQH